MDKLLNILNEIDESIDWEAEKSLIGDRLLDSFGVITLVSELEEQFSGEIDGAELVPENFKSAAAIYKMIQRLQEK